MYMYHNDTLLILLCRSQSANLLLTTFGGQSETAESGDMEALH